MAKMTDEELVRLALKSASGAFWHADEQLAVLAHIDAVAAERDELRKDYDCEVDRYRDLLGERDALRERVKALEKERADPHPLSWEAARQRVHAAESRVKVLEADADAALATLQDEQAAHAETLERMTTAASRLAAIRQRAGDGFTTMARDARRAVGVPYSTFTNSWDAMDDKAQAQWRAAAQAVARYIIGDDTGPSAPPEAFIHEKGLDAGVFDTAATPRHCCGTTTDDHNTGCPTARVLTSLRQRLAALRK